MIRFTNDLKNSTSTPGAIVANKLYLYKDNNGLFLLSNSEITNAEELYDISIYSSSKTNTAKLYSYNISNSYLDFFYNLYNRLLNIQSNLVLELTNGLQYVSVVGIVPQFEETMKTFKIDSTKFILSISPDIFNDVKSPWLSINIEIDGDISTHIFNIKYNNENIILDGEMTELLDLKVYQNNIVVKLNNLSYIIRDVVLNTVSNSCTIFSL